MKKIIAAIALPAIMLSACLKDDFNFDKLAQTNYSPDVALPLAFSSVTIQDIIKTTGIESTISVDADKFCTIIYRGNLLSLKASDLITIPDQTHNFQALFGAQIIQINN